MMSLDDIKWGEKTQGPENGVP